MSLNLGFNPVAVAVSFIKALQTAAAWEYDRKLDTIGLLTDENDEFLTDENDEPTDETGYQTDGSAAIHYGVSVGTGRGSAKVELTGNQLAGVATALKAFDPDADHSGLTPAECIERTISRDKEGVTSFKLSLAKNSRAVRIPKGEWENYCGLMQANAESVGAAVTYYRDLSEAAEKAASE